MALSEAEELELLELEEQEAGSSDTSFLQSAESVANEINRGLVSAVPGLKGIAQMAGIGVGEAETPIDKGLEFIGLGTSTITMGLFGALRSAAAPIAEQMISSNIATTTAKEVGAIADAVKNFIQTTAQTAVKNPAKFYAAETTANFGAGVGGELGQQATDSEYGRAVGELIGGTSPAAINWAAKKVIDVTLVGHVAKQLRNTFTKTPALYGRKRAADRIKEATDDLPASLAKANQADVLPDAPLTVIERSEDPGLLSLEASVKNETEKLTRDEQRRFADINRVIREEFDDVRGEVPRDQAREYLSGLVDERIKIAGARVEQRLADLSGKNRADASRLAREELGKAYDDAIVQEGDLWKQVDLKQEATAIGTIENYQSWMASMGGNRVSKAQVNRLVPDDVRTFLGKFAKDETGVEKFVPGALREGSTVGELKDLRSVLLHEGRLERAKDVPDGRKLSLLNELQSSLLDDMSKVQGDDALDMARSFSADLHTRFRKGNVGTILGHVKTGDASVAAELTLQSTLEQSKLKGAKALDDLLEASGDYAPAMRGHISDYLKDEFLKATQKSGDFNKAQAMSYMNLRKDVLDKLPETRKALQSAIDAQDAKLVAQSITSRKQSAAAIVLNAAPGREIKALKGSTNLAKAMGETKALLDSDTSGKALAGFRRAIVEDLYDAAKTNVRDANQQTFFDGAVLREAINDPQMRKIMGQFLDKGQIKRLKRIANTASNAQGGRLAAKNVEGIMTDTEGMVVQAGRNIAAAAAGRWFGDLIGSRGTVQIPAIAVKLGNRLHAAGQDPARTLLVDAIMSQDDKLLRAIMVPTVSEQFFKAQMRSWVLASAAEHGINLAEDE